jgi:hypothetical protein
MRLYRGGGRSSTELGRYVGSSSRLSEVFQLEAKTSCGDDFKVFRVIGHSDEECQAGIDRLIASGEALLSDHFFCRLIVRPGDVPRASGSLDCDAKA